MSEAGDEVVVARQLHKRFIEGRGASRIDVQVLQGVDLTLERGVLSVVGRNGMGKTTLCKTIMGLVRASS